jgi:hypothetical protein
MDLDSVKTIEISRDAGSSAKSQSDSSFNLALREKVIFEREVSASGVIDSTLAAAANESGVGYLVVDEFVDLLVFLSIFSNSRFPL